MHVVSINVSRPIEVLHEGQPIQTGIFKAPVTGPVRVGRMNLEGDEQADLVNHGGESKAVYAYSLDHYAHWQQQLQKTSMPVRSVRREPHCCGLG